MKENSEELKDYLRDLQNWENDAKKKDRELNYQQLNDENTLPPIRNQISKRRKKKKKNTTVKDNGSIPKNKRISGFDYSAWDKFDVDKALKQIDGDDKNSSSSGEEADTEDEELEIEKNKQKALLEKDKGNEFFKRGKYDEAIACYTVGIENDPSNAILPANRAMALLKKNQLAAAEADCDLAISIDSTYIKAYLRRGSARIGLKKLELALEDFKKVLELDSENKQAKTEILRIEKELNKLNQKENNKEEIRPVDDSTKTGPCGDSVKTDVNINEIDKCIVKTIYKPPHLRSKKPLKKIEIKEILSDSEDIASEEKPKLSPNSIINTTDNSVSSETVNNSIIHTPKITENYNVRQEPPPIPSVPQTAYQFYAHWQALRNYPDVQYEYLKKIPPHQIPKLFHQSMEAEIFSNVIMILKDHLNEHDSFLYLKYLTEVGRFRTLSMFLSSAEKKAISQLLESAFSSNKYSDEEINIVKKSYEL